MKSKKELAFAIITIALVFGLSGCGNKNVQKGGEGTNFPYSWQEKGNGEILVKLDGSSSDASYGWSGASEDDEIVSISEKGSEKKGKVSFILKPVAEGETVVTFIRDKAVEGTEPAAESQGEDPADLITEKPADTEAPDADEAAADEEDSSYVFDSYNERYAAKDIISKISFKISVGTDEKSGKLKATALANVDSELSGIIESKSSSFTYTLWEDENNNAVLKIPGTTEYAVNISST
ncbi:MAG: hypothetical protein J6Z02_02720, partial [Lachnospiraceae bacterium]|nr:hypothetical protein [Lachnospiraceae bacterium]